MNCSTFECVRCYAIAQFFCNEYASPSFFLLSHSFYLSYIKDQTCIITFFRRLGCKFCRLEAKNLSHLKPALDARNIKLMGITFDEGGVKEFVDGHYFDGGK